MRHVFDPSTSAFAGLDQSTLQSMLTNAQQSYVNLIAGSNGETFSYTQGDGTKTVTYTRADSTKLMMLIRELQACLGVIPTPRRAITPIF